MPKNAFEDIAAGLKDALAHARGEEGRAQERRVEPLDVAEIRARLNMTQAEFAEAFGVSIGTVRNWEQGRRAPRGPARALLRVIEREPKAVIRALGGA